MHFTTIHGLITVLPIFIFWPVSSESGPIVHIHQGAIRGTTLTSIRSNRIFFGFMGIPYAQPPLGELRFKAPQAPSSWSGVRNASVEGAVCPQFNSAFKMYDGLEDCLFVNVFTPKLPSKMDNDSMTVMIWIHGGDYIFGSGNINVYGPDFLIDEDVVVVTFNYRLGVLGFLSLQTEELPGNIGMKDQVFALKWVKKNIKHFGGNPDSITIFGQSAGAASVHFHLLSPLSRGLFQRAISESGSALDSWAYQPPEAGVDLALELGDVFGANTTDRHQVLETLKTVPARKLVEFIGEMILEPISGAIIGPTLDIKAAQGDMFLPNTPIKLINAGRFLKIPYMTGVNNEEAILLLKELKYFSRLLRPVVNVLEMMLPFYIGEKIPKIHDMAVQVKEKYFNNSRPLLLQYVDLLTDLLFINGAFCTAQKQAALSSAPVYSYEFSFNGTANIFKNFIYGGSAFPGACHGDELPYLFRMDAFMVRLGPGTPEYETSQRIVKMWTNFAKTGNPTPKPDTTLQNIIWMPINKTHFPYLSIDKALEIKYDLNNGNPIWWQQLYRKYTNGASPCWSFN